MLIDREPYDKQTHTENALHTHSRFPGGSRFRKRVHNPESCPDDSSIRPFMESHLAETFLLLLLSFIVTDLLTYLMINN